MRRNSRVWEQLEKKTFQYNVILAKLMIGEVTSKNYDVVMRLDSPFKV